MWQMGKRNMYRILVGKPEGKRSLGRPHCRWKDNVEMDLLYLHCHMEHNICSVTS